MSRVLLVHLYLKDNHDTSEQPPHNVQPRGKGHQGEPLLG